MICKGVLRVFHKKVSCSYCVRSIILKKPIISFLMIKNKLFCCTYVERESAGNNGNSHSTFL